MIFAAVGAGVIGAANIGKVPAALPSIRAEFALDLVAAGWIVAIYSATGMTLGMIIGLFADRIGYRRLVIAGTCLMGAGSALGALSGSGTMLLLTRLLEGVGFVAAVVAAPSLIAQAAGPAHKRFAFGMWGSYMSTGIGGMLLLSPVLLSRFGWRGSWMMMAAAALVWAGVMAVVLRSFVPGRNQEKHHGPMRDIVATVSVPGPWLLALCFGFYTLVWTALMVWLPTFLVEQRGVSVATAALLTVIVVLVNFPGNLLGGWLNQRDLPRWAILMTVGLLFIVAGPGIFLGLLPDGARFALACLFSFLGGMLPASILGGVPVFAPSTGQLGTTNGLVVQGSHLGQFSGAPLVAFAVTHAGGWQAGAWIFAGCGLGVVLFALLIGVAERRLAALPPVR